MVKSKFIRRLARGVFIRDAVANPSIEQVANVKAAAFGRKLLKHASSILQMLGLRQICENADTIFSVDSHSSSFDTAHGRVSLHGIGPRKIEMSKTKVGEITYALWHLGEDCCKEADVAKASRNFRRIERIELRRLSSLMPVWLHELYRPWYSSARLI
jgi:hypothetical protein